jgi:crotonobetainyl-CoA:carnitine CoA-transferase CaiB-like acyl-CoA transferase
VWLTLSAQDQTVWPAFCRAIGAPVLAEDARYGTVAGRFEHAPELVAALDAVFARRTAAEWAGPLDDCGMVWATVATLPDVVDDPQARANAMFARVEHPRAGPFETLAAPFTLSGTPPRVRAVAPAVGQHTREVLSELEMADGEVDRLVADGVIGVDGDPAAG